MIPDGPKQMEIANDLFPQIVVPGLPDYSCNIHSFGCSFWTLLGHRAGFSAMCEMPAPNAGIAALKGENVISDSAWFAKDQTHPEVLVEFERYSAAGDAAKLSAKVLVLAYWTKGLRDLPDHQTIRAIIQNGFSTAAREAVPGTRQVGIRFFQFLFEADAQGRCKLVRIIERGSK